MSLFWVGLISGLCIGGGAGGFYAAYIVSKLFETHRLALAQALSSERVLEARNDPARPRPLPSTPKTEYEVAMQRAQELKNQEAAFFGEK